MSHTTDNTDDIGKVTLPCPDRDSWLQLLCDRESGDLLAKRPQLQDHLDNCPACTAAVSEVRRFQTMVMRAKAPVLSTEQRQSLDERIRLQSGNWQRPPRFSPWLIWGTSVAAAAAIALLVGQPFADRHGEPTFAEAVKRAQLPASEPVGQPIVVSALEGDVEVAGADGHWSRLAPGMALQSGVRLRAENGGKVVVPGRFEVMLEAKSEVEALALTAGTAYLRVRSGEVQCQVEKLKRGERFAVMFGGFRASVVGTRFAVRQDGAGAGGQVVVSEGAVRVDSADEPAAPMAETTTVVRAGNRWQHKGGVMSLEPVPAPVAVQPAAVGVVAAPAVAQPAAEQVAAVPEEAAKAAAAHHAGKAHTPEPMVAPHQILIEVPHQTMPPPADTPNAPDGAARQK